MLSVFMMFYIFGCGNLKSTSDISNIALTCDKSTEYNADLANLFTTLSDCFFGDYTVLGASLAGTMNVNNNTCTYGNKTITFLNPNYVSWIGSDKIFSVTKSGQQCLEVNHSQSEHSVTITKGNKVLYKVIENSSSATIQFENRTWNASSVDLSGCEPLFNYISYSNGTSGPGGTTPGDPGTKIYFGLNHRVYGGGLVTPNNSQPLIQCQF